VTRATLFALLFALVLGFFAALAIERAGPERRFAPDSPGYVGPARALLALGRFSESPDRPDQPEVLRTPGYPVFLAAVWSVIGVSPLAAALAQVGFGLLTIALAARLSRQLGGSAAVTAWLLALDATLFLYTQKLLSETLFTCALLVTTSLALRAAQRDSAHTRRVDGPFTRGLSVGLAAAATAFVRPVAYFLGPLLGFALVFRLPKPKRLPVALGVLLGWAALVAPWHARNVDVNDTSDFSVVGSINLALCRAADVVALRDAVPYEVGRARIVQAVGDTTGLWRGRCGRELRRVAIATALDEPLLWLRASGREAARMLLIPGESGLSELAGWRELGAGPIGDLLRLDFAQWRARWWGEERARFMLVVALGLHWLLLAGLAGWGGVSVWRGTTHGASGQRSVAVALILGVIAITLAVPALAGCELYSRFRAPIDPLLAVLAGVGAARFSRLRPTSSS